MGFSLICNSIVDTGPFLVLKSIQYIGFPMSWENITHGGFIMNRIKTINTKDIKKTVVSGGCGECQTSCQSACKTSCGVANQQCENNK